MAKETNKNYLSGKEIRAIAKANAKEVKRLEAYKNRKADETEFTTEMRNPGNILEIEDLHTFFYTEQGVVKAVNGVSYDVPKNAVVGVVGESGCGKSVTSMSVMRLIQGPAGQIVDGAIRFKSSDYKRDKKGNPVCSANGEYELEEKVYDIAKMPIREIHRIRGRMAGEGQTLTAEVLSKEYRRLNELYFGPDMVVDEQIAVEWARIPHFYFDYYVFQYATGYSAAIALSKRILAEGDSAVKDYLGFLSGGCSKSPIELLKLAGVDMTSPEPVNQALELFGKLLDEMEELMEG